MHKTHIFDNKIFFLPTYLPYFFSDCYRKQTIFFLALAVKQNSNIYLQLIYLEIPQQNTRINCHVFFKEKD